MEIKEFTLMQKLLFCVNSRMTDRAFNEIAYYLLLHYNEIETISLKKIMVDCYASSSTIRRFCMSIGYENFTDLRSAKAHNQEDQSVMACHNWKMGRYHPRILHDQISNITYQIGRTIHMEQLRELAHMFVAADCNILFAIRPYTLFLEEFQCQMIAMGKTVYIFEEVERYESLLKRLGTNINHMVISPTGGIMSALDEKIQQLPGNKSLLICSEYSKESSLSELLPLYDRVIPLKIRTYDIEYMEMYGKYAVSYWFEILFGEILGLMQNEYFQNK